MNLARCASWVTGVSLGLGFLVVLNYLRIPFYLFYPRTTQAVLISPPYDYYLFLISSIVLVWIIALRWKRLSMPMSLGMLSVWAASFILSALRWQFGVVVLYATVACGAALLAFKSEIRGAYREVLSSVLIIFVLVECASIFYWLAAAVNPHSVMGMPSARVEADLTFFLYPVAVPMMLLLMFSWVWIPLLPRLSRTKARLVVRYRPSPLKPDLRTIVAALDLFGIVALVVSFYPYLAGQTWIVGQDSYWRYIGPANSLSGLSPSEALNTSASHGGYVFFIYLIQLATGVSPALVVKFAPLVLSFCLAAVVFFVCSRGGWTFRLAVLSSLATLLWYPTTVGIYVAIQDNWVALLLWMIFMTVYFGRIEAGTVTYVALAVLSLLILLVHPWTWGVFLTTLLVAAVLSRGSGWGRHAFRTLASAIALALPLGIAAYILFPSFQLDLANTVQLYVSGPINPASLLSFGPALANMFYNEGPALSPALLLLSIVGAYGLVRRRGFMTNYLLAWAGVWCLGSILVAPSGLNPANPALSTTGMWRMLYISPLPFFLALGMEKCLSIAKGSALMAAVGPDASQPQAANGVSRIAPLLSPAPAVAASLGLFMFGDPNIRLIMVLAASALCMLFVVRLRNNRTAEVLMATFLILLLFNAAFRTLYPLVLDPHSIFSSSPVTPGR